METWPYPSITAPVNVTISIPLEQITEIINNAIIQAVAGQLPPPQEALLLTVKDVAQQCKYCDDTVRDWIKNGRTVHGRIGRTKRVKLRVITTLTEGSKKPAIRIRPSMLKEFLDHFPDETL